MYDEFGLVDFDAPPAFADNRRDEGPLFGDARITKGVLKLPLLWRARTCRGRWSTHAGGAAAVVDASRLRARVYIGGGGDSIRKNLGRGDCHRARRRWLLVAVRRHSPRRPRHRRRRQRPRGAITFHTGSDDPRQVLLGLSWYSQQVIQILYDNQLFALAPLADWRREQVRTDLRVGYRTADLPGPAASSSIADTAVDVRDVAVPADAPTPEWRAALTASTGTAMATTGLTTLELSSRGVVGHDERRGGGDAQRPAVYGRRRVVGVRRADCRLVILADVGADGGRPRASCCTARCLITPCVHVSVWRGADAGAVQRELGRGGVHRLAGAGGGARGRSNSRSTGSAGTSPPPPPTGRPRRRLATTWATPRRSRRRPGVLGGTIRVGGGSPLVNGTDYRCAFGTAAVRPRRGRRGWIRGRCRRPASRSMSTMAPPTKTSSV